MKRQGKHCIRSNGKIRKHRYVDHRKGDPPYKEVVGHMEYTDRNGVVVNTIECIHEFTKKEGTGSWNSFMYRSERKTEKPNFMCFCGCSRCIDATHWASSNPRVDNFKFRKEKKYVVRDLGDY